MFADPTALPDEIDTDILIVGAGAAGITLARELQRAGQEVTVLEAGGLEFDEDTQQRYEGHVDIPDTLTYVPLSASRLRFFGGTTNHWSGWSRPFDEHIFTARPWVDEIQWPYRRDDLMRHYRQAHELCQLGRFEYDLDVVAAGADVEPALRSDDELRTSMWRISPPTRFGEVYREELAQGPAEVVLHANVTELEIVDNRVAGVHVTGEDGRELVVRADRVVLAAGGLETIRMLLIAHTRHRSIGLDRSGWLGRGFMEHPHVDLGHAVVSASDIEGAFAYFTGGQQDDGVRVRAAVGFAPEVLQREEMAAFSVGFAEVREEAVEDLAHRDGVGSLYEGVSGASPAGILRVFAHTEQRARQRSRIELADETDDLGLPRLRFVWRLAEEDIADIARGTELIASELGARGLGVVRSNSAAEALPPIRGGNHHMGGLRMHPDPDLGVVDEHLRVHALDNLYVASSAVFPTGGTANPTLTIVALALRLAEHLGEHAG